MQSLLRNAFQTYGPVRTARAHRLQLITILMEFTRYSQAAMPCEASENILRMTRALDSTSTGLRSAFGPPIKPAGQMRLAGLLRSISVFRFAHESLHGPLFVILVHAQGAPSKWRQKAAGSRRNRSRQSRSRWKASPRCTLPTMSATRFIPVSQSSRSAVVSRPAGSRRL